MTRELEARGDAAGLNRKLKALIVQHEESTPAGLLGEWLDKRNAEVEILRIDLEEEVPDAWRYDLVVSLGSESSSFDESRQFIHRETKLILQAVEADIPVLGLCFGSQLMAHVLGGRSFRADRSEIGWLSVRSKDVELIPDGPWFQWHFDSFTLPPDAELIAESDVGPQAYVIGRSLGLQFHPEVTPEIVSGWVRGTRDELRGYGVDPDALVEETKHRAPTVRGMAERLFDRFVTDVAKLSLIGGVS